MIINYRVEESVLPYLDENTRALLKKLSQIDRNSVQALISGQPLNLWRANGVEMFFDDCPEQIETPMNIGHISLLHLDPIIYRHLPSKYLGGESYATLQGYDESGNEYRMGILTVLGFEIKLITE